MTRFPVVGVLVGLAALAPLALAGGCQSMTRQPAAAETPGEAPQGTSAPMRADATFPPPLGMHRLPVEEALRLAKEELGRSSGVWRVETIRRIDGGWELHFQSRGGPADYGGRCRVTVTDAGRVNAAPAALTGFRLGR